MGQFDSYGKMPGYLKLQAQIPEKPSYDFQEILGMLRKGDSVITVQMSDTLMKQQQFLMSFEIEPFHTFSLSHG